MNAEQALADLTEISSQIQAAAIFDATGKVLGATFGDQSRADALVRAVSDLLAEAETIKTGDTTLAQLEVATGAGSVFVVRDGKLRIAATTAPNPTVGLVFYDLKSALRNVKPAPRRRTTTTTAAAKKKTTTTSRRKKTDAS